MVDFLTNRELALIVAVLLWLAVLALRWRRGDSGDGLGSSVHGLLSAIAKKTTLLLVGVYLCWMAAALAAADAAGLWDVRLVKAAALWWLLSGLGLLGTGLEAVRRQGAIVGALKRLVGVALVFEFVASAASFSLFVEIPLQILAVPCVAVWALASVRHEHRRAGKLAYGYLVLLGFAALGWGITRLKADWEHIDHDLWWRELVMPFLVGAGRARLHGAVGALTWPMKPRSQAWVPNPQLACRGGTGLPYSLAAVLACERSALCVPLLLGSRTIQVSAQRGDGWAGYWPRTATGAPTRRHGRDGSPTTLVLSAPITPAGSWINENTPRP